MQQYKIKCWIGLGLGLGLTILQLKNVISINAIGEPTTRMPKNSIDSVSTTGTEASLDNIQECFRGKTVHVAGNSNFRGVYFTMHSLLEHKSDGNDDLTGVSWENRTVQKLLCQKDDIWPPKPSCETYANQTQTTLVNTWTQKLENWLNHTKMTFSDNSPDFIVLQVGLAHVRTDRSPRPRAWEKAFDDHWPAIVDLSMSYFEKYPNSKLLISPVFHFNEKECTEKEVNNSQVDLWNAMLKAHLGTFFQQDWFIWLDSPQQIVDKALLGLDGLGMDDWVHPDSKSLRAFSMEIMRAICQR